MNNHVKANESNIPCNWMVCFDNMALVPIFKGSAKINNLLQLRANYY